MELFTGNPKQNKKLPLLFEENSRESLDCGLLKVVLIEEGSALLKLRDRSFVASAPALLCLNEGENYKVCKSEGLVCRTIYFSPAIINEELNIENIHRGTSGLARTAMLDHYYFLPFTDRKAVWPAQTDIDLNTAKRLSLLFDDLKNQMNNFDDHYWPCRNRSFLIEILFLVQHCFSKRETENVSFGGTAEDIGEIILYLHLHYDSKITISELTERFHTNRNTLNQRFRKETGLSVIEYIIKLRVKVACMLLRDTKLPAAEISRRVGFDDISYWGRAFKKVTGVAPSVYRKNS